MRENYCCKMREIAITLLVFTISSLADEKAFPIKDQGSLQVAIEGVSKDGKAWWCAPQKEDWARFSFHVLEHGKVLASLHGSKYNKRSGEYAWTDYKPDKSLEGILVIQSGEKTLAFRRKASMTHANSFGFVKVSKFDPGKETLEWSSVTAQTGFSGIIVPDGGKLFDLLRNYVK